jgi:prevent-host-death family protein
MPVTTTTISSREFNQYTSAAKKAADDGPVIITDRGEPSYVLITMKEYRKLGSKGKGILELLAMPGGEDFGDDFDSMLPARVVEDRPPFEFD